jgi:two-component system, OmpR family, response regulator
MARLDSTLRCGASPGAGSEPVVSSRQGPETMPAGSTGARHLGVRPLRVLLVEDSPLLIQRISELIEDLSTVELVGTASSETEAVARLEAGGVDAVILDLQLNTGSGFGVLRALKQRTAGPDVIVFTNFAIGAYRETALALGARHFLDKSRDYARLPAVLQELSDRTH